MLYQTYDVVSYVYTCMILHHIYDITYVTLNDSMFFFIICIDYVVLYDIFHSIEWPFGTLCGIAWHHMTFFGTTLSYITANDMTQLYVIL